MRRIILLILDGFGLAAKDMRNPRSRAKTPTFDRLEREAFGVTLQASGMSVGLPWGEPGNSEVGHLTMGAGRILYHHLPRIIVAIRDGTFFANPALVGAFAHARRTQGRVHLMGLVSSGSVHAYVDHLYALFELAKREGAQVFLHVFTDGRDADPHEAEKFLPQIEERMRAMAVGRIASVCGRHYAMDRSGAWPLTEKGYRLLTQGQGETAATVQEAIQRAYQLGMNDETMPPTRILPEGAAAQETETAVRSGDALLFFNFREDSARQISEAFADPSFQRFPRVALSDFRFVMMTEYQKGLLADVAFAPVLIHDTLGEVISNLGFTQLRVAETEKYAHVTYFFNGGIEAPFPREERILIPSYSGVSPDTVPEMRASEIATTLVQAIEKASHHVIIANFANGDMVGHTGNFVACAKALEVLDAAVLRVLGAAQQQHIPVIITADHGNVEEKIDSLSGRPLTEHSMNPVPLFVVSEKVRPLSLVFSQHGLHEPVGLLTDVAPTVLALLGVPRPDAMTGQDLLERRFL